jgi:hypothetical protein
MRRTRLGVASVIWLACGAAWASGSTRVEATGEHCSVVLETPRKIFSRGRGERRYHRRAKERLTRELSVLKPIVERALAKVRDEAPDRWRLRKYDAGLERCRAATDETEPAAKSPPCRLTIRLPAESPVSESGSVEVALESPPTAKDAAELDTRLQEALRAAYKPAPDAGAQP